MGKLLKRRISKKNTYVIGKGGYPLLFHTNNTKKGVRNIREYKKVSFTTEELKKMAKLKEYYKTKFHSIVIRILVNGDYHRLYNSLGILREDFDNHIKEWEEKNLCKTDIK